MEERPKKIIMCAEDTCSPLFWDEENVGIGEYDLLYVGDDEISLSAISGLKEWYKQADKFDPYSEIAQFTTEGMEEWINQGYEYAKQLRKMIPNDIELYYGFWH
mgnify:FL=1